MRSLRVFEAAAKGRGTGIIRNLGKARGEGCTASDHSPGFESLPGGQVRAFLFELQDSLG